MIDLDELMRLHEAATPGPWEHKIDDAFTTIHTIEPSVASYVSPANAAYIVAACNAVPELVARIRELEAELYEAVGYIISNESQSMIDCRICFFEQYCERKKDQWKPAPEMCWKAIMHCITTEEREEWKERFKQVSALQPCRIVSNNNSTPSE